jgi:hypothetical protein
MDDFSTNKNDILSSEIKNSYEFDLTDDFDKRVKDEISNRIVRKSLIRQYLFIIGILIVFLFCILFLFHINASYNILKVSEIHNSIGFWRYKYVSITILSLSLVFMIDKVYKLKTGILK